ncbi:MAG: helix-turn-helix domain-containing protein [Thiothrix sp.]|nr:MAG: helix-turn-helix domain-containing protein [Thiothrix sp.]
MTFQSIEQNTILHEVVARTLKEGITPIRAWREYLQLTQADMAERLGISQSAYAQQEAVEHPRKTTRAKIAKALNIDTNLLDF